MSLDSAIKHATTDWWASGAALAIRQLALADRGFDADHVLDMVGRPPSPECVGAVFAAARRSNVIEAVGCRVGRDGRLLRVWWGLPATKGNAQAQR